MSFNPSNPRLYAVAKAKILSRVFKTENVIEGRERERERFLHF